MICSKVLTFTISVYLLKTVSGLLTIAKVGLEVVHAQYTYESTKPSRRHTIDEQKCTWPPPPPTPPTLRVKPRSDRIFLRRLAIILKHTTGRIFYHASFRVLPFLQSFPNPCAPRTGARGTVHQTPQLLTGGLSQCRWKPQKCQQFPAKVKYSHPSHHRLRRRTRTQGTSSVDYAAIFISCHINIGRTSGVKAYPFQISEIWLPFSNFVYNYAGYVVMRVQFMYNKYATIIVLYNIYIPFQQSNTYYCITNASVFYTSRTS